MVGMEWLEQRRDVSKNVYTDTVSDLPGRTFLLSAGLVKGERPGYLLIGNTDTARHLYRTIIQGEFMEYTNTSVVSDQDLVYSSGHTTIYVRDKAE